MTAADVILRKALVGSDLNSKQWLSVQAGMRDRAFFSSGIFELNFLSALRGPTADHANGETDLSKIRMEITKRLKQAGYKPEAGTEGTIKDLFSKARLDVIVKTNVAQARGFIQYAEGMTPGAFAAFPAQEFTRIEHRNQPRTTWPQRWKNAGGKIYGGRMIAVKDDPVWYRLSTFGDPHPPFDFGSGMGVMDVSQKEAIALGVITKEEIIQKRDELREREENGALPSMNKNLQASFPAGHWSGEYAKFLHEKFGDQIRYEQDQTTGNVMVRWQRCILHDMFERPDDYKNVKGWGLGKATPKLLTECDKVSPELRKLVEGRGFAITDSIVRHTIADGHWLVDNHKSNMPVGHGDVDLVPSLWRSPSFVERGKDNDSLVLCLETLDGGILKMPVHTRGITPFGTGLYKEKEKSAGARPASIP